MSNWRFALGALMVMALLAGCQYLGDSGDADDASASSDSTATDSTATDSTATDTVAVDTTAADSTAHKVDSVPVETAPAVVDSISSFLLFSSTIETEAAVEVHPQVSGLVEAVEAEEGDQVEEGGILVRLDDDQARLESEESEINFRHLESRFSRTQEMYRRKLISTQDYEDQQLQLDQARLRRDKASLTLTHTVIRAPFSGVITARYVQTGGRVAPGAKLFDLVKLEDMIARVFVPGRYLSVVKVRQRSVVESEFLQGMSFEGYVKRISPVVDPKSGTFKVTIGLRDRWRHLRPGIFANVQIITDTHPEAILVPKQAIVYDGGNQFVFVIEDSTAVKVRLDAGFENSQYVEALSLIEPDTPIIVVGQNGLKDQSRVKVVNAADTTSAESAIEADQG